MEWLVLSRNQVSYNIKEPPNNAPVGTLKTDYAQKNYSLMNQDSKDTAWFISAADAAGMPFVDNSWGNLTPYYSWYTGFDNGINYL